MSRYEIVTDERGMTVTVGPKVFDRPALYRLAERNVAVKCEICGDAPWQDGPKAAYQFYASFLGPKFNRRFQAANYWLWLGNRMTARSANMLRRDGSHWRDYNGELVWRANSALPYVNEAERDVLFNIVPVIVTFAKSPQEIRRLIGRGAWRRVANNSVTRNCRIMQAMERMRRTEDGPADPAAFLRLLEFPSGVMRGVYVADDDEVIAARITPRKTAIEFQQTVHLVRDTRRMLGRAFNPSWGFARVEREHHTATREIMRGKFSDRRFADDWTFDADGFAAELLTSQLDIATEGAAQHHCVASYARQAANGGYAVFRIEGKERATAGLRGGRIDQVYGACNNPISDECRAFVYRMAEEYAANFKRRAA